MEKKKAVKEKDLHMSLTISGCMKQYDYLIMTESLYKQLIFWVNDQHLHRQSNKSKLVSAMPNFHAKTKKLLA